MVAFHLPSIDVSRWRRRAATAARSPRIVNSRPMMTSATHGDARSTATSATSAVVTSSLSAVVSRKAPRRVVTPHGGRGGHRPSGGGGDEEDGRRSRVVPVEHERHDDRREQDPHAGASGEQTGRAQPAQGAGLHGASGYLRTANERRAPRTPRGSAWAADRPGPALDVRHHEALVYHRPRREVHRPRRARSADPEPDPGHHRQDGHHHDLWHRPCTSSRATCPRSRRVGSSAMRASAPSPGGWVLPSAIWRSPGPGHPVLHLGLRALRLL